MSLRAGGVAAGRGGLWGGVTRAGGRTAARWPARAGGPAGRRRFRPKMLFFSVRTVGYMHMYMHMHMHMYMHMYMYS